MICLHISIYLDTGGRWVCRNCGEVLGQAVSFSRTAEAELTDWSKSTSVEVAP